MPRDEDEEVEEVELELDEEEGGEEGEKPWWSEAVRDLTSAGLATVFMTEDSIRNYLKEKKLPKELATEFLEKMGRKKDGAYRVIGKEVGKFLSKIDVSKEVSRFLESHQIQLEAKVSFEPREGKNKESKKDES